MVVTGPDQDTIAAALPVGCERALQLERRGTGDAVRAGLEPLEGFEGDVVVLVGDAPLVGGRFLQELVAAHRAAASRATVATAVLAEPAHYGRVLRDQSGGVTRIVEARDAAGDELRVCEVNTGFYVFDAGLLRDVLPRLEPVNAQGELYLTDAVHIALADGVPVNAHVVAEPEVMLAINSRVELAEVNAIMRRRLLERLMLAGVTVEDPALKRRGAGHPGVTPESTADRDLLTLGCAAKWVWTGLWEDPATGSSRLLNPCACRRSQAQGPPGSHQGVQRISVTSSTRIPRPSLIETHMRICARAAPPAVHSDAAMARPNFL